MKKPIFPTRFGVSTAVYAAMFAALCFTTNPASRAIDTWNGGGHPDGKWVTRPNWIGGSPPNPGDALVFSNTVNLTTTNNFPPATLFSGITFASPSGGFVLNGNSITLGGDVTDNQVVTPETINLNMALNANRNASVVPNSSLLLNGIISGSSAGLGLTVTGGGSVTLGGANTFSGNLNVNSSTIQVVSDSNLGAAPASA